MAKRDVLFVGIDGGGSKCRARLESAEGRVLGLGQGGGANAYQNLQLAQASIVQSVHSALSAAGLAPSVMSQVIAGVGLAGVNVPSVLAAMQAWRHPFKQLYITTDLHIACLGAHKSDQGAVIVVGTGSCGYVSVSGQVFLKGGHGFPLGDQASGAWIGLAALKSVLLAADGLGPATFLTEAMAQFLGVPALLIPEQLAAAKPQDYARLAPLVIAAAEAGDAVAVNIVQEGAAYLNALGASLWLAEPGRMSLMGGLALALKPWLAPSLLATLSEPLASPEWGGVYFARQEHFFGPCTRLSEIGGI